MNVMIRIWCSLCREPITDNILKHWRDYHHARYQRMVLEVTKESEKDEWDS